MDTSDLYARINLIKLAYSLNVRRSLNTYGLSKSGKIVPNLLEFCLFKSEGGDILMNIILLVDLLAR